VVAERRLARREHAHRAERLAAVVAVDLDAAAGGGEAALVVGGGGRVVSVVFGGFAVDGVVEALELVVDASLLSTSSSRHRAPPSALEDRQSENPDDALQRREGPEGPGGADVPVASEPGRAGDPRARGAGAEDGPGAEQEAEREEAAAGKERGAER